MSRGYFTWGVIIWGYMSGGICPGGICPGGGGGGGGICPDTSWAPCSIYQSECVSYPLVYIL